MPNDCIFCKIIKGEIPTDFLYKDKEIVAFKDINPQAPVHILITPVKHIPTINEIQDDDLQLVGKMVNVAKGLAKKTNIAQKGYKLIINVEKGGGQEIFHIHMHLMGGW